MSAVEKFMKLGHNASFLDALAALKETGAALLKIAISDADDKPLAAMIVVRGQPETGEIVDAVNRIETNWDADGQLNTTDVLKKAEEFIARFEDDPAVEQLLRDLRILIQNKCP